MYPRTNYEMSEDDLQVLLAACKPTPVMFLSGGVPMGNSTQENANRAWEKLGEKMGFDAMTVRPNGSNPRFFTAIPSETEEQRNGRLVREAEQAKLAEIAHLSNEIETLKTKLESMGANKHNLKYDNTQS